MAKRVLFSTFVAFSLCLPSAKACVLSVPGEYATIRDAIDNIQQWGLQDCTIVLAPGTYDETVYIGSVPEPGGPFHFPSIQSTDPDDPGVVASTIIQGGIRISAYDHLMLPGMIQVSGLTIRGGGINLDYFENSPETTVFISNNILSYCLDAIDIDSTYAEVWIIDNMITGSLAGIRSFSPSFTPVHVIGNEISGNYVGMEGHFADVIGNTIEYNLEGGALMDSLDEFGRNTVGYNIGTGVAVFGPTPNSVHDNYIVNNDDGLILGEQTAADNNTIVANDGVGVTFFGTGLDLVRNSIIYANGVAVSDPSGTPNITYTCSNIAIAGDGNLTADPLFASPAAGDYHLTDASPCINRGTPDYDWSISVLDHDEDLRVSGGRVDIGADETPFTSPPLDGDLNGDGTIDGLDIQLFITAMLNQ